MNISLRRNLRSPPLSACTATRTQEMKGLMKPSRLLTFVLALAALFLLPGLAGCLGKRGEMGVRNSWRGSPPPAFEKGRSTQSDVMRALGPPSQVIALQDQTLFYYLREQSRTKAVFLIIYNQVREQITYDRALFFFSKEGTLVDFSYSAEAIPLRK
jgi:hypothetical protein